ncbi:MAG: S8 family serine peptidase, partial [Myxococcota bacterium]
RLPNLAVVGAADGDWLAGFSNRSRHHVDLIAQGTRVLGRVGPEAFERMSGTSMAAAAVSNAIARCLAVYPELTPEQVLLILQSTAQQNDADYWLSFSRSTGPIDVQRATQMAAVFRMSDAGLGPDGIANRLDLDTEFVLRAQALRTTL